MPRVRTLRIKAPLMRGDDVLSWQRLVNRVFDGWGVQIHVKEDGVYGMGARAASKMLAFGLGFTHEQFDDGITPWLRERVRNPELRSEDQKRRIRARKDFRDRLREKFADDDVAPPLKRILVMTWGWHPPVHDGIDLICGRDAPLHAICDGVVIDVRAGGWWGKAPSGNVALGDGIVQIRSTTDEGPFEPGWHFGYGHAERARVKVGQKVEAGQIIAVAGLAVVSHTHFMANRGEVGLRGVGTMDPEPFVRYAMRQG